MQNNFGRLAEGLVLLLALVIPLSCGSDSGSGPVDLAANPCATPNATYLETFAELSGGTCGPIPQAIVNVNPDGTITSPMAVNCAKVTQSGCTSRNTDCRFSSQGFSFTATFATTFAQDGSSAMGLATLSGSGNGQSCTSTYQMNMVRQ